MMKLYDAGAPNPRRVRMYLAEKEIEVEVCPIDFGKAEQRSKAFLKKNPLGLLPVLELEDGRCIAESYAIIDYFERQYPENPLIGTDDVQRAQVIMWDRRMESELLKNVGESYQHTAAFFKERLHQIPEYGKDAAGRARKAIEWLNEELGNRNYIAGDEFSIADITALVAIDLGTPDVFSIDDTLPNLASWYARVTERPSSRA